MMTEDCTRTRLELCDRLDSKDPVSGQETEHHLSRCESCRRFAADVRRIHYFAMTERMEEPPRALKISIMSSLAAERRQYENGFLAPLIAELATMALLCLVLAGGTNQWKTLEALFSPSSCSTASLWQASIPANTAASAPEIVFENPLHDVFSQYPGMSSMLDWCLDYAPDRLGDFAGTLFSLLFSGTSFLDLPDIDDIVEAIETRLAMVLQEPYSETVHGVHCRQDIVGLSWLLVLPVCLLAMAGSPGAGRKSVPTRKGRYHA